MILSLYLLFVAVADTSSHGFDCPLWTSPQNGSCKCGNDLRGLVKCEDGRGAYALISCFCMTIQDNLSESAPVVGSCLYQCRISRKVYNTLLTNENHNLNNKTCGPHNRAGIACGKCIEGYGLPVYSYNLSCVECTDYKYNWLKYIAVAYGPLTVFYFIIVLFRISTSSGLMVGYVTVCQTITTVGLATELQSVAAHELRYHDFAAFGLTLMSIWNLDFFRSLYPPFCLHPHLSALQAISLDYIVAVYPMILVLLTYLLVKLHDRFRLVVWLCRPAYTCFRHFRKEWDIKTSLIGAFATFFLLSYVKILDISTHLLTPTYFYHMNGSHGKSFFFYNGTVHYFGKEHLPYAALAITLFIVLTILPLVLLCLYPCPCFQRCLNRSRYKWYVLHSFMDAIFAPYTCRPRERRYFAAIYLIVRISLVATFTALVPLTYPSAASSIWMLAVIAVAIFRPYRKEYHNFIDIILFSFIHFSYLMSISFLEGILVDPISPHYYEYRIFSFLSFSIPVTYGLALFLWITLPCKLVKTLLVILCKKLHFWKREREIIDSLPYRLEHDNERYSLLTGRVIQ